MSLKNFIVLLVLTVEICLAGIPVETTEPVESSDLIDAAVHILTSCYGEHGPIGISGPLPKTFLSKLWSKKPIPVILVDRSKRMHTDSWISRGKLRVVLLIATAIDDTHTGVVDMMTARWYDHKTSILVFRAMPNIKPDGCKDMNSVMRYLRYNELVNVNLMCRDEKGISIFSANPFTNWAPPPWDFMRYEIWKNIKRTSFFLFWQRYKADDVCVNLDYDRTKDMGGGTIDMYMVVLPSSWTELANRPVVNRADIELSKAVNFWEMVFRQLNAKPKIGLLKKKITKHMRGVAFQPSPIRDSLPFFPIVHPVLRTGWRIVTQYRGYKSQLTKILTVVDTFSRYCVGVVLSITLLFFKFVARQHLIPGILNVVRMTCNTGFTNVPERLPSRTYLACLFLFVVTMHGIFAGNLALLLTNQIPVRQSHTIEDLVEFNYTIYATTSVFSFLNKKKSNARLISIYTSGQCNVVFSDPRAACIYDTIYVMLGDEKYDLHVSDHDILETYQTFEIYFWPAYAHRLSEILLRIFEADVMYPLQSRVKKVRTYEYREFVRNQEPGPKVMTFNNLAFAFVILGIGLGCATITFIVEISLKPGLSKIAKARRFFSTLASSTKAKVNWTRNTR